MLVKSILEFNIEIALQKAMKSGFEAALQATANASENNQISSDQVADAFAQEAKKCAGEIATAIDNYIKSATVTLNTGTIITSLPTLISPTGPVSGAITVAAPVSLMNAIN